MFGEINHPTMGKGTPMALGKPLWATLRMVDLRSVQHFATMWLQYIYIHIYIYIFIYIYTYLYIYIILMDLVISKQYLKVICWINELIQDEKNCGTPGYPTNFSFSRNHPIPKTVNARGKAPSHQSCWRSCRKATATCTNWEYWGG